tara:strand:+ start:100 stop:306 length:207 start_codon:yes stop_codon:yes gene_type:complete
MNFDLEDYCAHLILEKHFYLTTLQAELRVTTLCIERGVVCGKSDCEELVGVTHRGKWGWFLGSYPFTC